jgi:hypothetical protein
MTCIVGQVDQKRGRVFVGGDCAGTGETNQQVLLVDPKVFRVDDFLFGCVGDIRMMQLLHYSLELPPCPETVDLARYLSTDFITAVRTCFRDGGYAKKKDEREHGGTFLVGARGRLFCVEDNYQVWETQNGYHAIGSGDDLALGVLYASQQIEALLPEQRIRLALEAAAFHNATVRPPFLLEYIEMGKS